MTITIARDAQALALVRDQTFVELWQRLFDRCPWATVTQSATFVQLWSEVYRAQHELVLIYERTGKELTGLLPLARDRRTGRISAAGGAYAEYQVWLATPEASDRFITQALDALTAWVGRQRLQLVFTPPRTPLEWARTGAWASRCEVREIQRPLMDVSDSFRLEESLRKKHTRSHIKRLQRHGRLQLTTVATGAELADVHDEINAFAWLRLSAVHGEPIRIDPLKKTLFARLLDAGLIHATLLRAGNTIVSAQVHWRNGAESLLGIIAFSPMFARDSPSNIHTLMLGLELNRQGVPTVDLTPGGEYKERFATHGDTACILTVFGRQADRWKAQMRKRAVSFARGVVAARAHSGGADVERALVESVKLGSTRLAVRGLLRAFAPPPRDEYARLYTFDAMLASRLPESADVRLNAIHDLVTYRLPRADPRTPPEFHRVAAARLSDGCELFTQTENGGVARCYWLAVNAGGARARTADQHVHLPDGSALIFDVSGRAPFDAGLAHVIRAAAARRGVTNVFVAVPGSATAVQSAIVALGCNPASPLPATVGSMPGQSPADLPAAMQSYVAI